MPEIFILIAICIFNIVMWIVFMAKFKRLFTTDDIVEKTRTVLNSMLIDINKNASRNIDVIEDRIRQLKAVTAEADRHLMVMKGELNKVEKSKVFLDKLDEISSQSQEVPEAKQTRSSSRKSTSRTKSRAAMAPAERYVTEQMQGNLFNSEKVMPSEKPSSEKRIPVIEPEIYMAEKPVVPKKDFNTSVREMYDRGESVEEIAAKLGRSTQEVKFSLEFS